MHKKFFFLILTFVSLFANHVNAERYYFQHLGLKNKLSQSSVLCILQDKSGFMWFGTKDGLNRYDGSNFRTFKYDHKNPQSLGNNAINSLHENKDGNLWIGTDNGIYLYNPIMESFSKLEKKSQDSVCITQPIVQITADSHENIWLIVESQGVFFFDNDKQALFHYPVPDAHALSSICVDQQNTVWLGYKGKGLYYTNDTFRTLQLFTTKDGKNLFATDHIFKILPEQHNTLYTGSAKGGLKSINIVNQTVTDLLADPQTESIFVRTIYPINKDVLWIGTERGVYTYDKNTKESRHFTHDPSDDYSLSDNAIYSICKDKEGGIWIGNYFCGIDYYPNQYATFEKYYPITGKNSLSGKVVREFCEDEEGNLWIGTEDGGLNKFNTKTKQFTPLNLSGLHYNIHALSLAHNTLWIGTYSKGLYALDLKTNHSKHYTMGDAENELNDNNIYSMCRTSSGELYIGTTTGLNQYNYQSDNFTRIHKMDGIFIFSILEDSKRNIWFATYNSGIFKYNPRDKSWKNYVSSPDNPHGLPYNKVISIYEDSKQRLWFSILGHGFCSLNEETETFISYDSSQGLANDVIYKIIEEKDDILWLTSNKGLIRFDLNTKKSTIYTDSNGLLTNQFNYCSGIKSKDGTIYLGCINGFIAFKPDLFTENTSFPPVAITDFLLFNKSADIGSPDSPLAQSVTYTQNIELKYNQNSFSFRFAALGYASPEENCLSYTLKGFDKEWYYTSKSATATYTNLKPGTYTFCVKAANGKGEWNDEYRKIQIHIAPPFWKTVWAYIIYVILAIIITSYTLYRFRKQITDKHKRQLEVLESEKEKEIYHAKIDFFTNIAHEIRTPLTLIKGPLENILKKEEINMHSLKDNLSIMERNTMRLLDLTNQLLDFRKTEAQGFQLNFMICDISQLIKDTYIRFDPAAKQNDLTFNIELPEQNFSAAVDKEALTKILSNLFNNAVKYAKSYIHVTLHSPTDKQSDFFSITVSNDGLPIPLEMKEKIFEPFVQIKNVSNGQPKTGTGIGLPLARSLTELHRGKLYLKDSDDICFCIELPIKQEKTILLQKTEIEKPVNTPTVIRQHQTDICILVVEDDPEMQNFISSQLGDAYSVMNASNGKEALKILSENTISLVVSDVMMPEMNGFELCRTLKTNIEYSHIPIILLTAKATIQSKIEGIELGADDYIEKPFSTEYLLARIANLLSNQEKLRQAFTSSPFVNAQTIALTKADEAFLEKLTEVIKSNISEPEFNVDILAEKMNMSRSSLHRKIKGIAQITPNEFIQLERLKMAAQLIQSQEYKINEVCYIVGFNSSSYFAKCFQKQFGVLPKDFVNKPTGYCTSSQQEDADK